MSQYFQVLWKILCANNYMFAVFIVTSLVQPLIDQMQINFVWFVCGLVLISVAM